MHYYVTVDVVLESKQKGAYESGTILRAVQAAFPSRADLDALLPAGVRCMTVNVTQTNMAQVAPSIDGPDARNFPRPMGAVPQGDGEV